MRGALELGHHLLGAGSFNAQPAPAIKNPRMAAVVVVKSRTPIQKTSGANAHHNA